jgi:hypothetical protein
LTISKNGGVDALNGWLHDFLADDVVDGLIRVLRREDAIERERLADLNGRAPQPSGRQLSHSRLKARRRDRRRTTCCCPRWRSCCRSLLEERKLLRDDPNLVEVGNFGDVGNLCDVSKRCVDSVAKDAPVPTPMLLGHCNVLQRSVTWKAICFRN